MKIKEYVIKIINSSIDGEPPETGGILGSSDGKIVTEVIMDKKSKDIKHACSYSPNVDFLNLCIDSWLSAGKLFMGIFHTHFAGVKTLSCADKKYIADIMNAMPQEINTLYFPIFVLPDRELVCYKATKKNKSINIELDALEIISEGGESCGN